MLGVAEEEEICFTFGVFEAFVACECFCFFGFLGFFAFGAEVVVTACVVVGVVGVVTGHAPIVSPWFVMCV